jgi:hypothetical protein
MQHRSAPARHAGAMGRHPLASNKSTVPGPNSRSPRTTGAEAQLAGVGHYDSDHPRFDKRVVRYPNGVPGWFSWVVPFLARSYPRKSAVTACARVVPTKLDVVVCLLAAALFIAATIQLGTRTLRFFSEILRGM